MSASRSRGGARNAIGCLAYLLLAGAIATGLEHWFGARMADELRPWPAIAAAVFFTLALGSVWSLLSGLGRGGASRAAILARAATGAVPDSDGIVIASGPVRPAAGALRSPFNDTPCVAYMYRIWDEVPDRGAAGRRREVPHYWGYACRPFVVETPTRPIRVRAVPQLTDEPRRCDSPEHRERARHWVRETRFEPAAGMIGAVGSAIGIVSAMLGDDDGEARGDWSLGQQAGDPGRLHIEETVVAVGAGVAVAGPWSAERHAIVPSVDAPWAAGIKLSTGPVAELLRHAPALPPSHANALAFTVVFGALGGTALLAGIELSAMLAGP